MGFRLMRIDGESDAKEVLRVAGCEVTAENVNQILGSWVSFAAPKMVNATPEAGGSSDIESSLTVAANDGKTQRASESRTDQDRRLQGLVRIPGRRFSLHAGTLFAHEQLGADAAFAVQAVREGPAPLTLGRRRFDWSRPVVMGIVNVTPDSFSDGGHHLDPAAAIAHGLRLVDEGADILDIGGESTRPKGSAYGAGASTVPVEEEIARVLPVIRGLAKKTDVPLSIDTRKSTVAQAALEAGVTLVNDVSGLVHDPLLADVVARFSAALCLMHVPRDIEELSHEEESDDVLGDVLAGIAAAIERTTTRGVPRERLLIDPGLGFGKTVAGNFELLNHPEVLAALGVPVLIGASRKSSFARVAAGGNDPLPPSQRLPASLATAVSAVIRGAHVLRVHDVRETVQAVRVAHALVNGPGAERR